MRVVGCVPAANDRVKSDLVWHLESFFLIVGDFGGGVWEADRCRHFSLEVPQFQTLSIRGQRITDPLIGSMGNILLGVEAFRGVELYFEPLPFLRNPSGINTFVLQVSPRVPAQVHLVP